MGLLDSFGNIFNNTLDQSAFAQQQQRQYLNQWYKTYITTTASTDATTYNIVYPEIEVKKKGPESALEWLDRRVDEMRVPLYA